MFARTKKLIFTFSIAIMLIAFFVMVFAGRNVALAKAGVSNSIPIINNTITKGEPGLMTVENEIKTALMPVGHCLYIYGGGWNEDKDEEGFIADRGANDEAATIGIPQIWSDFYDKQDKNYTPWDVPELDFDVNPPCVHWGNDCSGYLGWMLRNITNQSNGFDTEGLGNYGWVTYAQWIGWGLQHLNYGTRIINPNAEIADDPEDPYSSTDIVDNGKSQYSYVPGNIYTFGKAGEYHCWLCLGQCADGSVMLLHCSDPGVFICGTSPDYDEEHPLECDSQSLQIARTYMKRYYTDFYNKFGVVGKPGNVIDGKSTGYLKYSEFDWNSDASGLADDEGYRDMTPAQVMANIYCEHSADANLTCTGIVPVVHFNDALVEPNVNSNTQIVYNRQSEGDQSVNLSLDIPAGEKFYYVSVNGVDYTSSIVADSNVAKIIIPISNTYDIVTSTSPVASPDNSSESAATSDWNYFYIAICFLLIAFCGYRLLRKE